MSGASSSKFTFMHYRMNASKAIRNKTLTKKDPVMRRETPREHEKFEAMVELLPLGHSCGQI
jgi:hypothetical protein